MSSARNRAVWGVALAVLAGPLFLTPARAQEEAPTAPAATEGDWIVPYAAEETAPAVSGIPDKSTAEKKEEPSKDPAKDGDKTEAADSDEPAEEGEVKAVGNRISDEQILQLLQSGGRQLSIADLAAVNDMIKRLEYQVEVERKMSEMNLGGVSSAAARSTAATTPPPPGAQGSTTGTVSTLPGVRGVISRYAVAHISGSRGEYVATVVGPAGPNSRMVNLRKGDSLEDVRVFSVTLSGVKLVGGGGIVDMPFISPPEIAGVSVTAGR